MQDVNLNVYIASPLFTPEDNATLDRVESILAKHPGLSVFSPRKSGSNGGFSSAKTREERAAMAKPVFDDNMKALHNAHLVLVNIDSTTVVDKNSRSTDVGTAFEMGYAYALQTVYNKDDVRILSFSSKGFGTNIMLRFSSDCHLPNLDKLEEFIDRWQNGEDYHDLAKELTQFEGDLY